MNDDTASDDAASDDGRTDADGPTQPDVAPSVSGADADVVWTAEPVPNVADDPRTTYLMDPEATVEAIDALEAAGLDVVGFYHSHPESDPVPSATDERRATWPGYVYLLCSPDGRTNAYRWSGEAFEPLRVVTAD